MKPGPKMKKMNRTNHKSVLKNVITFSLIIAIAGLMSSCKSKEKCPAYGKVQPAKHSTIKNS
jgi:hypothetical protein